MPVTRFEQGGVTVTLTGDLEAFARRAVEATAGADSQHCDCCWPQTRGAAAGAAIAAPGGVKPGGRCPKHLSYFHTSIAMYRSLNDLQPVADTTAVKASDASSPRAQSCARIDPSPRAAVAPAECGRGMSAASRGRHHGHATLPHGGRAATRKARASLR